MKTFKAGDVRQMALSMVDEMMIFPIEMNHMQALRDFPWGEMSGPAESQQTMAEWNVTLDIRSCLGRVAHAAAFVELHFPGVHVRYAEVLSDMLRDKMLGRVLYYHQNNMMVPEEFLQETLMYEDPHAVVRVNRIQFDPLSTVSKYEITHPKVQTHSIWDGIASAMMVSQAYFEKSAQEKLNILAAAESMCPGTTLVQENKVFPLVTLGKVNEAVVLLRELSFTRPCARTLYVLFSLTGRAEYLERLNKEYTPLMFDILEEEARQYVAQ